MVQTELFVQTTGTSDLCYTTALCIAADSLPHLTLVLHL